MLTEFIKYVQAQSNFGPVDAGKPSPIVMPEGVKLKSLESFNETRYRERYTMKTSSIDAFIKYVNERSSATIYTGITSIDSDACEAHAMFNALDDGGDAGHCDDTAACTLKPLPVYAMLQKIGESSEGVAKLSQRELIDLIRDWHDYIAQAGSLVDVFTKITVENVRNKSNTERDFGVEKSALEKIDVKAENAEIPSDIVVSVVPYDGFTEREIIIGVSALVDRHSDEVKLRLRVRSYEKHKLEIADEFAAKLSDSLAIEPFIGTIQPA